MTRLCEKFTVNKFLGVQGLGRNIHICFSYSLSYHPDYKWCGYFEFNNLHGLEI